MPPIILDRAHYLGVYTTDYGGRDVYTYTPVSGKSELIWGGGGHYGYPRMGLNDVGGSFLVNYNRCQVGTVSVGKIQGGHAYQEHHYEGSVAAPKGWSRVPDQASKLSDTYGASAWARMKPDKPNMQLLNAVYELREVPEMLRQRFLQHGLSEIGNYYLALKFGWEPLLRDVRDFVITHRNAQQRLAQLIRDEGKPVKRRITLNDSSSVEFEEQGQGNYLGPGFVSYFYGGPGFYKNKTTRVDKIWASARFRYWLPPGPRDVEWKTSMLAKIFGLKPTPRVIYNAIPWSWLIDWFTNLGDLIDNLDTSLVDRLAADYFYVMRQSELRATQWASCTYLRDKTLDKFTVSAESTYASGSKCRMKGDPFGWATPEGSLSGVQLSILGALGLSRLR